MTSLNSQPIEKRILGDGQYLDVHSIFFTIQGEGPFTGERAIFVRLAGCNLQCPLCDTDYTTGRERMSIRIISNRINALTPREGKHPLIVITGGEPFRQEITSLVFHLIAQGYLVQIESNGTLAPPSDHMQHMIETGKVVLIISPKTGKMNIDSERLATAFKYVVNSSFNPKDGLPDSALDHPCSPILARPSIPGKRIYIQPADVRDNANNQHNTSMAIRSCQDHGHTLQLQVHKMIGVE